MEKFSERANYPISYGDSTDDKVMVSDRVIELTKNKKFQSHMSAVAIAFLTIGSMARPSVAIPPEYGEAATEAIKQATQNGTAGAVPPVGPVEGVKNLPVNNLPVNNPGPQVPRVVPMKPANPPAFYLPAKPLVPAHRMANTALFGTAVGIVCLNAFWGEPVAIMMCATGLTTIALKIGKEVVIFMAKNVH